MEEYREIDFAGIVPIEYRAAILIDESEDKSVVAFFDGKNFISLTPPQIKTVERMGMGYVPYKIPPFPNLFVIFPNIPEYLDIMNFSYKYSISYKNIFLTWKKYYEQVREMFNRIWIVVEGDNDLGGLGRGMSVSGMYNTREEAADAIISGLMENFEEDASGVLKFDLGSFGHYAPIGSGGIVTIDELKRLLVIHDIGVQNSSYAYYTITYINRDEIPV